MKALPFRGDPPERAHAHPVILKQRVAEPNSQERRNLHAQHMRETLPYKQNGIRLREAARKRWRTMRQRARVVPSGRHFAKAEAEALVGKAVVAKAWGRRDANDVPPGTTGVVRAAEEIQPGEYDVVVRWLSVPVRRTHGARQYWEALEDRLPRFDFEHFCSLESRP